NVIKYVNLDDYVFPQTTMHENKSVPVISVSPNPASGMVRISGEFKNPCSVKIVDLAGKIILNQSVYQKSKVVWLDLTGIPAGIYILKFISGDNRFTQKLVIKN
ncbi:MAG: T9SS type A sorting domain-containing protein, partial [Bacteroidales bacterium]|nr:T9SS type A sorting domain-containing protein [Bacteroidales bacterium]